ncbi:MAG: ribonuclease P protein component [Ignavibacteria bacterium]|nr:ribonuclease P protein component [Ignavibacteria bacterium]
MNYKFETIKKKKELEDLLKNGIRFNTVNLRAIVSPRKSIASGENVYNIRFAVQVPKKTSKKAVVRNRIKRLLRESLRKVAKEMLPERFFLIESIFLLWRSTAPSKPYQIHLQDVLPNVSSLCENACVFIDNKFRGGLN